MISKCQKNGMDWLDSSIVEIDQQDRPETRHCWSTSPICNSDFAFQASRWFPMLPDKSNQSVLLQNYSTSSSQQLSSFFHILYASSHWFQIKSLQHAKSAEQFHRDGFHAQQSAEYSVSSVTGRKTFWYKEFEYQLQVSYKIPISKRSHLSPWFFCNTTEKCC